MDLRMIVAVEEDAVIPDSRVRFPSTNSSMPDLPAPASATFSRRLSELQCSD
jgi:hypothetical protein